MKKSILETRQLALAAPLKPNIPDIIARTRKITAKTNKIINFFKKS